MTCLIDLNEGTQMGAIVAPRSQPLADVHYVGEITAFGPAVRPFTWEVLSGLPPGGFQLTRQEVLAWVAGADRGRVRSRLLDTKI
jgi:hypothetical protein